MFQTQRMINFAHKPFVGCKDADIQGLHIVTPLELAPATTLARLPSSEAQLQCDSAPYLRVGLAAD